MMKALTTILLATFLCTSASAQWYGGVLKNRTSASRTDIKVSADGKLTTGGSGVRQVPAGGSAQAAGVSDVDMVVAVVRYGTGPCDFRFYTKRIRNLQRATVRDASPAGTASGWDSCQDLATLKPDVCEAILARYWNFNDNSARGVTPVIKALQTSATPMTKSAQIIILKA